MYFHLTHDTWQRWFSAHPLQKREREEETKKSTAKNDATQEMAL